MSLVSNPFTSVTLASKTFGWIQFVSQSSIHTCPRYLSKSPSLVFLPLMMFKASKETWVLLNKTLEEEYSTSLVVPLHQNDFDQCTALHRWHRFFTLLQLHIYICNFCLNGGCLHTLLLDKKATFSWCVELMLPPTWHNSVIRTAVQDIFMLT